MSAVTQKPMIDESIILKPYEHLHTKKMKSFMDGYIEAMNQFIQAPEKVVEVIKDVVYMIYLSLILTDDVIDDSKQRNNIPTAHQVFGIPRSLSASWYSFFMATEKLQALKKPMAVELLLKHMKMVYEGHTLEISWRDSNRCPTEQEFEELSVRKVRNFLLIITDLLQLFGTVEQDLTKLTDLLSFYYQVVDDIDDFQPQEDGIYCEDINEGKFGLPLVVAINRNPDKLRKLDLAAEMRDKASRTTYITSLLKETNALDGCEDIANAVRDKIRTEVNALGGSEVIDVLLDFRFN